MTAISAVTHYKFAFKCLEVGSVTGGPSTASTRIELLVIELVVFV